TPRLSAADGHDVKIDVTIVVGAEGDLRAIRRKPRRLLRPARRTQPQRGPAILRRDPDIAAIDKGDLRLGNGRHLQHPRIDLRGDHFLLGVNERDSEKKETKRKREFHGVGTMQENERMDLLWRVAKDLKP